MVQFITGTFRPRETEKSLTKQKWKRNDARSSNQTIPFEMLYAHLFSDDKIYIATGPIS